MRKFRLASLPLIAASGLWLACSSSNDTTTPPAGGDAGAGNATAALTPALPCTDSIDSIYADPGALPASPGDIIKCAKDYDVSATDLQAKAAANVSGDPGAPNQAGYDGKPLTSGAHVYRILYRTERGDTAKSPGYSSARVFIPDTPRSNQPLPIVVGARGSRGQAPKCVASKEDPSATFINGDYEALSFPIVGAGLPLIVPDLAGYAAPYEDPKNPISGYAEVNDVGKGTLDGARAMLKLFPHAFSGKVVLIGHSQGGHSALASLAIQPTYAPELQLAGVASYAPLWIAQRSWGAIFVQGNKYPLTGSEGANAVAIWYHYTHSELLDGPGHGTDVFAADKKDAVKHFVENDCWGDDWSDLHALGKTALDVFDPAFVSSVEGAAAFGSACNDDVCKTWMARYLADRPSLTGTTVPILITYGSADTTIPPGQMACVIDRLKNQDHVGYQFCLSPGLGHGGNVRHTASYVADWIAAQTLGEAPPPACAMTDADLVNDAGAPVACSTPPPNE